MIKNLLLLTGAGFLAFLLISSTLGSGGSNGTFTGSPLDNKTCASCHNSYDVTEVSWITTNIPEAGWIPSETYSITITASSATAQKMGFELTAENTDEKVGVFTFPDDGRMKLASGSKTKVTHTSDGVTPENGHITWEATWTAPDVDKGDVTFYAAINAANGNSNTSGDSIFVTSITSTQDASSTAVHEVENISLKVFPNPASDYLFVRTIENIRSTEVINLSGQIQLKQTGNNSNNMRMDVSSLQPGIYVISANTEVESYTRKIRIQ